MTHFYKEWRDEIHLTYMTIAPFIFIIIFEFEKCL